MRTKVLLLIVVSVLSPSAKSQEWRLQQSGTQHPLRSISFADSMHGWAVGDYGTILRTTNGGLEWLRQNAKDTTSMLRSVYCRHRDTCWSVGLKGVILKTVDGGATWRDRGISLSRPLNKITFSTYDIGWIVGGSTTRGVILQSIDRGDTWQVLRDSANGGSFNGVHFVDSANGWIVGYDGIDNFDPDVILHTSNAGRTWEYQNSPRVAGLTDVAFSDTMVGYATGKYHHLGVFAIKTTDGGNTWHQVGPQLGYNFFGMSVSDTGTIRVAGDKIYSSTDGGSRWRPESRESESLAYGMSCVASMLCWSCGAAGKIWKYRPIDNEIFTDIQLASKELKVELFDNGSNSNLLVRLSLSGERQISIGMYDVLGRLTVVVDDRTIPKGSHIYIIDNRLLSMGAYYLVTSSNKGEVVINKYITTPYPNKQ